MKYKIGSLIWTGDDRYFFIQKIITVQDKEYYEIYDIRYPNDKSYMDEDRISRYIPKHGNGQKKL